MGAKKMLFTLLMTIVVVGFSSCKNEIEKNGSIVGTWSGETMYVNIVTNNTMINSMVAASLNKNMLSESNKLSFTFKEDLNYSSTATYGTEVLTKNGVYALQDKNKVILDSKRTCEYTVKDNKLTLVINEDASIGGIDELLTEFAPFMGEYKEMIEAILPLLQDVTIEKIGVTVVANKQ